jgi:predicted ester cyclase
MSLEANKDLIRTYVETVFNQRQVERADQLVAPDYVDHAALPGQAPGLEGGKRKWAMYLAGIPDLRVTIEELVAEGDKVAVRRSYAGTYRGELLAIPPTANRAWLRRHGIQPRIARRGVESSTRLGRHRWRLERSLSWLSCCRRLQVRWDRDSGRWFAFVLLACAVVCFNGSSPSSVESALAVLRCGECVS